MSETILIKISGNTEDVNDIIFSPEATTEKELMVSEARCGKFVSSAKIAFWSENASDVAIILMRFIRWRRPGIKAALLPKLTYTVLSGNFPTAKKLKEMDADDISRFFGKEPDMKGCGG